MVSNVFAGGEGWPLVDALKDPCTPPDEAGIFFPGEPVPSVVHYCQGYRAGELGIMKHRTPKQTFTCAQPLLLEPPADLGFVDYHMVDGTVSSLAPCFSFCFYLIVFFLTRLALRTMSRKSR